MTVVTASSHFAQEADNVLRTLIVALGGFCAVAAAVLALWHLFTWALPRDGRERAFAGLLFGVQLLSYAGLAMLTTDHIYRHLVANNAPAWQLWTALTAFTLGGVTLVALISVRFDRRSGPE